MYDLREARKTPLRDAKNKLYLSQVRSSLRANLEQNTVHSPRKNIVRVGHRYGQGGATALVLNSEGFVLTSYHLVRHFKREKGMLESSCIRDGEQELEIDRSFFAWDEGQDPALLRVLEVCEKPFICITQEEVQWGERL